MKLGNFEAIPEEGSGNFATSIYEDDYDGLLIARCNQNGRYPEHARAILEGLNGKRHGLDQITTLTAERDSLKALCDEMAREARLQALEEAAKIAENEGKSCDDDYPGETWIAGQIAAAIRALSESSPNPLQEQTANIGKEGG
ncbi:hypothetical protein FFE80_05905 [Rhizobium rhizogenes]|nr:hypothetical protein [Rhizobium rhizogenes]NTI80373.1 hypothetical protein [Rhizobium rhizogenes]TQO80635.1 hypothetical protein FFE80_05905 [Rhizobium rhizogenes]